MSRLLQLYSKYLNKYPFAVQVIQTSFLMGSGDIIAQFVVEKKTTKTYNVRRTAEFTMMGGVLVGPALTIWYRQLAKTFGTVGTPAVAFKKILCDQCIFAPTILSVFLVTLGFVQGKEWKETKEEVKLKYKDILLTNYCLWPAANLVNFYLMPLHYQVLFANVVALFWNIYLSWETQRIPAVLEEPS